MSAPNDQQVKVKQDEVYVDAQPYAAGRQPPRVLHTVYDLSQGGCERLLQTLANRLPDYEVQPYFYVYGTDTITGMGAEILAAGLPIFAYRCRPGWDWRLVRHLVATIKDQGITHLHTHDFGAMTYGALAKLFCPNLRLVHTEHTLHLWLPIKRRRLLYSLASRLFDRIICVSAYVAAEINRRCHLKRNQCQVIANGIASASFAKAPRYLRGPLEIINVSRISPEKNLQHTLVALRQLADLNIPFHFTHIGSGAEDLTQQLQDFVATNGLSNQVSFLGFCADVKPYLARAHVFVSSSLEECHPVAVLESLAAGCSNFCSAIPAHVALGSDVVSLFALEDDSLCQQLAAFYRDPAAFGHLADGWQKTTGRYELDRMVAAYASVYTNRGCHGDPR